MRLSQMLFVTLREDPAEAEIPSHKLLLRAGYIRRIGSGVYAYLPLMWRVLQKVSQIVREEMNAAGAQECLLPQLQPAELWQESGRWDTYTKAEGIMFSLVDRQEREMGLGPTHEEVITTVAREMIRSYRQLPTHLYQIQTKFRDEIRPRFGLMRGREFIMKDGYSFHATEESLKETYQAMHQAYSNMFRRCGLAFRAVEADSGAIGGSGSQEFMILAEAGEDEVLYTEDGKYAANVEKAVSLPVDAEPSAFPTYEKRETPGTDTIEKLCQFLKCSPTQIVKNVLYDVRYRQKGVFLEFRWIVLVSIRGDQEVNEVKLQNELSRLKGDVTIVSLQPLETKVRVTSGLEPLPVGYIAPQIDWSKYFSDQVKLESSEDLKGVFSLKAIGQANKVWKHIPSTANLTDPSHALDEINKAVEAYLKELSAKKELTSEENDAFSEEGGLKTQISQLRSLLQQKKTILEFKQLVDQTAVDLKNFVTGANESGYHVVGANWGDQFQLPKLVVDLRKAKLGDRAVHDPSQTLQSARGIEAGHIFQLGTKYSKAMGATYTNEQGEEAPLIMGCYGVGVSRVAQAAVEQSYDKDGIIWPVAIAPYQAIVVIPNVNDAEQVKAAETLYSELNQAGIDTLLDDRNERAGVKFKDADLIGIPYRIVTGKSLKDGKVEVVQRATKSVQELPLTEVVSTLQQWVNAACS
ncbi:proline--tRNA ligase [Trichocoleus sp. FACHB-591]|uniref:proline--tRNA ligase n=1 Tax=Trichocoleus sp. FACHB-591 TaxID=2692872 RepID=UPI00168A329F|nr:proline--tRNA ligase [Trichocoleus sp. FACHB-591]MBD2094802.1 proline--tRNA ligase [Trichocoleus sp. FACHB-591]